MGGEVTPHAITSLQPPTNAMGGSSLLDAGCQALAGVPAPALAAAALALGVLLAWRAWGQLALLRPPLPPAQPTRGDPADPLVLCDFPLAKSGNIAASFSPFVGKVHTALRLAGEERAVSGQACLCLHL